MGQRRDEPQARGGDHRQRPLAAGEQAGKVVPGVVLHYPGQPPDDRAVGKDRLEADELPAHRPVAHDAHATRVGGHHTADRCRVPGSEVDAELPPRRTCGRVHR
jgi:hypothetical protein